MESLLGFKETTAVENRSCGYKLVPWLTWDEWGFVRESLFSSSPLSVASALKRIYAWRSRGCLPVVIEVTASIIEIQQKDPFFRADLIDEDSHSEEMLTMLYCMAIMRLVNGVVEKTRKKTEVSIAEAADAIGIPRMLIDIRHEGSHRDLPSLQLVRLASIKALDWLKSYYWEPQKKAIPFQRDGTAHVREEIKSKLRELAFCLKVKQSPRLSSSLVKGKRYFLNPQFLYGSTTSTASAREAMNGVRDVIQRLEPDMDNQIRAINQIIFYRDKEDTFGSPLAQRAVQRTNPGVKHCERLYGRNKFFSLIAGKVHCSKSGGSKKQITKALRNLVGLYSSFSSEVVSVLLEYMLKALDSLDLVEHLENSQVGPGIVNLETVLDDWKLVITKFSNKEPELLLSLLKAVLDMIETPETMDNDIGGQHLMPLEYGAENHHVKHLSSLFACLVRILKGLKPSRHKGSAAAIEDSSADSHVPRATLIELLSKCLLVSTPGNDHLIGSALLLAHMIGNNSFIEKLNKLSLQCFLNLDVTEENSSLVNPESLFIQQGDFIRQAAETLERVKLLRMKSRIMKTTTDGDVGNNNRWVVAKSWNPCPIGMLPRALGSSGCLPVLHLDDDHKKDVESSERKKTWELNQCTGKREASCDIELLENSSVKRMRETVEDCESDGEDVMFFEGVKGRLMIGGEWKKVGEEELIAIKSAIRTFV